MLLLPVGRPSVYRVYIYRNDVIRGRQMLLYWEGAKTILDFSCRTCNKAVSAWGHDFRYLRSCRDKAKLK